MSVYKKLQQARVLFLEKPLTKSGHNKFAGYHYFELGDFMPAIQLICEEVGICGTITFKDIPTLVITDSDKIDDQIIFNCPMATAALKGCHDVQNLGAVITYIRRYLWQIAFEIVESDALDATTGSPDKGKPEVVKPNPSRPTPPTQEEIVLRFRTKLQTMETITDLEKFIKDSQPFISKLSSSGIEAMQEDIYNQRSNIEFNNSKQADQQEINSTERMK